MIAITCPCCEVDRLPHRDGCTFYDDAPCECENFDEACRLREEIDRLRLTAAEREAISRAAREVADLGYREVPATLRALLDRVK